MADDHDEMTENRRTARKRHWLRYRQQLIFWVVTTGLAAASVPLAQWNPNPWFFPVIVLALAALLFLVWLYHIIIYKSRVDHEWSIAVKSGQATLSPHSTAEGYTQVFGVYVETKRRSAQLITLAALLSAFFGVGASIGAAKIDDWSSPPAIVLIAGLALGLLVAALLLRYAYVLGSSYLAGDVIVRHTLALALHATSQVSNLEEAKKQVEGDTQAFMRKSPWWFFSGRRDEKGH